jgi:hypothetical protein
MPDIDPKTYLEHYQHARGAAAAVAWCTAAAARGGALLLLSLLHYRGLWDTQATRSKETHIAPTTPVLVKHTLLTASSQAQTAAQALLLLQYMLPMHPAGWALRVPGRQVRAAKHHSGSS